MSIWTESIAADGLEKMTLDLPEPKASKAKVLSRLSQMWNNKTTIFKNIFSAQNLSEIGLSAFVMFSAKTAVLTAAGALSAPFVATYAATVSVGGVVGGLLRTRKDWLRSQKTANDALAATSKNITPAVANLRDEFVRKASQGYFDFARQNKTLVRNNILKSAFFTAVGGTIGQGLHHVASLNLEVSDVQKWSESLATSQDNMALQSTTMIAPNAPAADIDLAPDLPQEIPSNGMRDVAAVVSKAADKPPQEMPSASVENITDAPKALTTRELNLKSFAAIKDVTPTQSLSTVDANNVIDDMSSVKSTTRGLNLAPPETLPETTPVAVPPPASSLVGECEVATDHETLKCVAKSETINTGETLRVHFDTVNGKAPVDFVNGDKAQPVSNFIQRVKNFAPFQQWMGANKINPTIG